MGESTAARRVEEEAPQGKTRAETSRRIPIHFHGSFSFKKVPRGSIEAVNGIQRRATRSGQPGAGGFLVYSVSKGLADLAVRDFKRAHPDFDVTTIHPSYIYGPLGSGQVYNTPASGTNRFIYGLISGAPDRPVPGYDRATRGIPSECRRA